MPRPKNGEVDYPAKIHALSAYLTPSCRELMEGDARRRKDAGNCLTVCAWCMKSLSTGTGALQQKSGHRTGAGITGWYVWTWWRMSIFMPSRSNVRWCVIP